MEHKHRPIRGFAAAVALVVVPMAACRPPAADVKEAYPPKGDAPTQDAPRVDHTLLHKTLATHVRKNSLVDYAGLRKNHRDLDAYIAMLGKVKFEPLSRDEKLVLLINAYNAFTLALILDHWPLKSINDIPTAKRWDARRWQIGQLKLSLNDIEHKYLRSKFREPRIHFAINCASIGCPPLRAEAYRVKDINAQLQEQAKYVHSNSRWFELDAKKGVLRLTKLYDWFKPDFVKVAGSVLDHAARFNKELATTLRAGRKPSIEWMDYDWQLNAEAPKK